MEPTSDKIDDIRERLGQAKQTAEIGKAILPGKAGKVIDRGTDIIDVADESLTLFQRIRSIFKKKNK